MKRLLPVLVLGCGLLAAACSTKTYLQEQVAAATASHNAKVGEVQKQVEATQMEVAQLKKELAQRDQMLAKLAETSREALMRAEEAGKVARPCPWVEAGEFCPEDFPLDIATTTWADITGEINLLERGFPTVGDTIQFMADAIRRAGLDKSFWYTTRGAGFVVVTDYEKIDRNGRRISIAKTGRFYGEGEEGPLARLASRIGIIPPDEGLFRAIALVVTDQPFGDGTRVIEPALPTPIVPGSGKFLPRRLEAQQMTPAHRCIALLFEFERSSPEGPVHLRQGSSLVPVRTHLHRAELLSALQRRSR